jgi:predicted RNase H-like HicB family nuclease
MRHAAVVERASGNYGAYVPDRPGCVAVGRTRRRVRALIRDAGEPHLMAPRERGERAPQPGSTAEDIEA